MFSPAGFPRPDRFRAAAGSYAVASLLLIGLATAAGPARAQTTAAGFAVDRFEPASAGSEFMSIESLDFAGHLRPAFGLVGAWAWKPLVVYDPQGEVAPLVRQELVQHVQAAILMWDRARFDIDVPVPFASGTSVVVGNQTYGAPEGAGIGDVRVGGDVRVFGRARTQVTGAVGAQLFIPTGDTRAYTSDGGVRFWPRFTVGGWRDRVTGVARLGLHLRPQHDCNCDLSPGSELTVGGGASWRFSPRLAAGPELYLASAIGDGRFASRAGTSIELLLAGHVAVAPGWNVSLGFAPGLSDGAGTPVARGIVGVQYVVEPAPPKIAAPQVIP